MIGEKLSPILVEIESAMIDHELNDGGKPEYTFDGFRAASRIFMTVLMDKIWELQKGEEMEEETRLAMVLKCGQDLRNLIKTYTNLDSYDFYK